MDLQGDDPIRDTHAAIPAETNYLLNPLYPEFSSIGIWEAEDLVTDLRLVGR